jgi:hypothetical protein
MFIRAPMDGQQQRSRVVIPKRRNRKRNKDNNALLVGSEPVKHPT